MPVAVVESDNHIGIAQEAARDVQVGSGRFRIERMVVQGGPSRSSFMPLCDGEHEKRDATAKKSAGNDVVDSAAAGRLARPAPTRSFAGVSTGVHGCTRVVVLVRRPQSCCGGVRRAWSGWHGLEGAQRSGAAHSTLDTSDTSAASVMCVISSSGWGDHCCDGDDASRGRRSSWFRPPGPH